jgi:hypothetical protein
MSSAISYAVNRFEPFHSHSLKASHQPHLLEVPSVLPSFDASSCYDVTFPTRGGKTVPHPERKESLQTSHLGIIQIDAPLPPLDVPAEEIVAQADELVRDQAAWAERQDREDQVHGVYKYPKGLIRRIKRKSVEPLALALEANNVQSMQ